MNYRCLILDHDDTTVDSTPFIHHPAHVEQMRQLRPGIRPATLMEWMYVQTDPGFGTYMNDVQRFTPEEMVSCGEIWRSFVDRIDPEFFPGMVELLRDFHDSQGIVAVVTHSEADVVERNYRVKAEGLMPDAVIGWSDARERHKPDPWPVGEILRRFDLQASEVLVVDDQMPGITMANTARVDSAAVGWSHRHPAILAQTTGSATVTVETVADLRQVVFGSS